MLVSVPKEDSEGIIQTNTIVATVKYMTVFPCLSVPSLIL